MRYANGAIIDRGIRQQSAWNGWLNGRPNARRTWNGSLSNKLMKYKTISSKEDSRWSSAKVLVAKFLLSRRQVTSSNRELTNTLLGAHRIPRIPSTPRSLIRKILIRKLIIICRMSIIFVISRISTISSPTKD